MEGGRDDHWTGHPSLEYIENKVTYSVKVAECKTISDGKT